MFDADFANGLYFFNGVAYPDETTFLAAIGGSKAGNIRTIGPYDIPGTPNLLTNGDLASGTSPWAAYGTGASIANVSNELELTTGGAAIGGVLQGVSGVGGRAFKLTATGRKGTGTTNAQMVAASDNAGSLLTAGSQSFSTTSNATKSDVLGAYADPAYFGLRNASAAAGTYYFDNLSLTEVLPFQGFVWNAFTVIITASPPASNAGNEVLWAGGTVASDTSSFQIRRNSSDDTIRCVVTRGNGTQIAGVTLGAVADGGGDFTTAFSFTPSLVSGSLNGGAPVTAVPSSTLPGIGKVKIGDNMGALNPWNGTIKRVTML